MSASVVKLPRPTSTARTVLAEPAAVLVYPAVRSNRIVAWAVARVLSAKPGQRLAAAEEVVRIRRARLDAYGVPRDAREADVLRLWMVMRSAVRAEAGRHG